MRELNKALFLDLDGTIIKTKSGETFGIDVNDWEFVNGVLPSIKRYVDRGYIICIVSNQGGIELGKILQQDLETKLQKIRVELEDYIRTDVNIAYCPSMDNYDRKPYPGMAYYLARELRLDLKRSIMVGDMNSDQDFSVSAGIGAFLFITQFVDELWQQQQK